MKRRIMILVCLFGCGGTVPQSQSSSPDLGRVADLLPATNSMRQDMAQPDVAPPDQCAGVVCTTAPAAVCADSWTVRSFSSKGACNAGVCAYPSVDTSCGTTPPPDTCADGKTQRHYAAYATCSSAVCAYSVTDSPCTPPPPNCINSATLRTVSGGACLGGTCTFSQSDTSCVYGCVDGACNATPRRLFVTRETYSANFGPQPDADSDCNVAAKAAGLSGTWKAWLADPSYSNAPSFKDVGPWYAMDGKTRLFNNAANLGGFPQAAIQLDEFGAALPSGTAVWTGLTVGLKTSATCYTWNCFSGCSASEHTYTGTYGKTGATDQSWTDAGSDYCAVSRHLYCLEQ